MRERVVTLVLSLGIFLGIVANVPAQAADQLIVDVPFSFIANGAKLPAGTYRVRRASMDEPGTLLIRDLDGLHSVFLISNYAGISGSKLVFDVVGDEHYLREVSTSDGQHDILSSRAERQAETQMRNATSNPSSASGK